MRPTGLYSQQLKRLLYNDNIIINIITDINWANGFYKLLLFEFKL